MNRLDLASNNSRLDGVLNVTSVLDVLTLAHVDRPRNERALIRCPLPGHNENTGSFKVQPSGKGYRCFGCGAAGGVLDLTVALGLAPDRPRAVEYLANYYRIPAADGPVNHLPTRSYHPRPRLSAVLPPPATPVKLDPKTHARLANAVRDCQPIIDTPGAIFLSSGFPERTPPIAGRGITPDAADFCGVRYHPNWLGDGEAVVFAGRNEAGTLVAAQGRFIDPRIKPKSKSIGKIKECGGVFSTPGAASAQLVGITEAPIDAITLAICGIPSFALMGTSNVHAWLRRRIAFTTALIATDNDPAGDHSAILIAQMLTHGTRCERLHLPAGFKDPNKMLVDAPDELAALLDEIMRRDAARYAPIDDLSPYVHGE
jgi:hypothetical protein